MMSGMRPDGRCRRRTTRAPRSSHAVYRLAYRRKVMTGSRSASSTKSLLYKRISATLRDTVAHKEAFVLTNQSGPTSAVVPILIYTDVPKAIDWLSGAFGFRERLRAADRDGVVGHAQLLAGVGDIM